MYMKISTEEIIENIYYQIFMRDSGYGRNIFLCGKKLSSNVNSVRKQIYERIKDIKNYNVVLPEWIFEKLIFKNEYNLLNLEKDLADFADIIIIPLEGFGAVAELGAFSSSNKTVRKLVILNKEDYKDNNSFIDLGPLKLIISRKEENVIFYKLDKKSELEDFKSHFENILKIIKYTRITRAIHDYANFFNLSRFILYIVAVFWPVSVEEIRRMINNWDREKAIPDYHFSTGIEILKQKAIIKEEVAENDIKIYLTDAGYDYLFDKIAPELNTEQIISELRLRVEGLKKKVNKKKELKFLVK